MIAIVLRPTTRIEEIAGIKYRIYVGRTNTGIDLEMLGLFRVTDPLKRAEFERAVCAVKPGDPEPVKLLSTNGLIIP